MYDILVQKEVFYTLKFVCGYFYWLENNTYIFAKQNPALLAQKFGGQNLSCLTTKKKKLWVSSQALTLPSLPIPDIQVLFILFKHL